MVGEACLPSNLTIRGRLITPFILGSMSVGLSFDSSFVYGFMSLDNGLGTMTTITILLLKLCNQTSTLKQHSVFAGHQKNEK